MPRRTRQGCPDKLRIFVVDVRPDVRWKVRLACRPFLTHLIGVGSFFLGDDALSIFFCFSLSLLHFLRHVYVCGVGWLGLVVIHMDHELAGGNEHSHAAQ